jgi:RimJ/RimL family protein N-acetyltransferase
VALDKVTLDGEYVRLEPLEERHREAIRPAAQHPEIFTITTSAYGQLYDPYIDNALRRSDSLHEFAFAVWHKELRRHVGMTRYLNIDEANKRLEIGSTWYEPAVWAGVVNPECKFLLMRHAFEKLKFHRIEFKTDARNARSRAAILKLGAQQEGVFRKHMVLANGFVRDSVYFSIIDDEWPVVKAGLEKRLRT